MERLRVLLIHANPFQRVLPVPPYGLERIRTEALRTGAEVEILDPYLLSDRPCELTTETVLRVKPDVVGLSLRIIDDSVIIERLDAPASEPTDITWFLPEIRRLREALRAAAPGATIVLGGATFSYIPREVLDYLDVEWGVVGPGESPFCELLRRLSAGRPLEGIPGLLHRNGADPTNGFPPAPTASVHREGVYAPTSCFPIQTRIGCAMKCSYCLTASLRGRNRNNDLEQVLDEVEDLVGHARRRGLVPVPIFFADDEFNLPGEDHAIAMLEGLVKRRLERYVQWRAYFNPVPFSPRLTSLIASTNGHASITVDTASEPVMARNRKPFRLRHLAATLASVDSHGVSADLTFLFGLPGEDRETIAETVGFMRRLPRSTPAGYGLGARVYPHTPLAEEANAQPDLLVGPRDPSFLAPVVYCSPCPPRQLARELERVFSDRPHVTQSRGAYGAGVYTSALAYRVALGVDPSETWRRVLELAADSRLGRVPQETLGSVLLVALWHGRYDLAAAACREIAAGEYLPSRVTTLRLRAMAAACSGIARAHHANAGYRAQSLLRISRTALRLSAATKPW